MDKTKLQISALTLHWDNLYKKELETPKNDQEVNEYFCSPYPFLDPDFANAVTKYPLAHSRVLELGSGLGEQSVALAKEAKLDVYSLEISKNALNQARQYAENKNADIHFINDNLLTVELDTFFSAIFDRGCFTTIPHPLRPQYVEKVSGLIEADGYLFLKANGAIKDEIVIKQFSTFFELQTYYQTVYHSLDERNLAAKFFVFRRVMTQKNAI